MKNMLRSNERWVRNLSRERAGCAFLLLLTTVACLQGIGAQVDQENWDLTPTTVFSVARQEFTPTLDSLDSAQLLLSDKFALGWPGGPIHLDIRAGGADGPVIATSQATYVSPWYAGLVGFGFAEPVSVVPGQIYALEPVNNIAAAPFGVTPPRYSGGRFFGNFQVAEYDLIFREGIGLEIVPEPSPGVLFTAGFMFILGALWLSARHCVMRKLEKS
jgi:hypothetical protein